jgi:hypothetical protein
MGEKVLAVIRSKARRDAKAAAISVFDRWFILAAAGRGAAVGPVDGEEVVLEMLQRLVVVSPRIHR